jgi:hypothetical protein
MLSPIFQQQERANHGERFNRYCQAIAEAPAQLGELRKTWAQFPQDLESGREFHIGHQGDLLLGPIHARTIAETNGSFKIRFARIERTQGDPTLQPAWQQLGADWSLSPIIDNGQFKWVVAEPHNQAFTNDELADEVAINLIELSKRKAE